MIKVKVKVKSCHNIAMRKVKVMSIYNFAMRKVKVMSIYKPVGHAISANNQGLKVQNSPTRRGEIFLFTTTLSPSVRIDKRLNAKKENWNSKGKILMQQVLH